MSTIPSNAFCFMEKLSVIMYVDQDHNVCNFFCQEWTLTSHLECESRWISSLRSPWMSSRYFAHWWATGVSSWDGEVTSFANDSIGCYCPTPGKQWPLTLGLISLGSYCPCPLQIWRLRNWHLCCPRGVLLVGALWWSGPWEFVVQWLATALMHHRCWPHLNPIQCRL